MLFDDLVRTRELKILISPGLAENTGIYLIS